MKFNHKLVLINIALILASISSVLTEKLKHRSRLEKMENKNLIEESRRIDVYKDKAKDYIIFARLPYCSNKVLLGNECSLCAETSKRGYKILEIINKLKDSLEFNMVISKSKEELIFSFGGPKSSNIEYFEKIYTTGFRRVNDLMIENEFYYIYENFFRNKITEAIKKFNADQDLRILFIGHSLGGSLAQLASWDLVKAGALKITEKGPFLITYGALKIGPKSFIDEIQQRIQIPVLRISRKVDLFSLMPRCIWIPTLRVFHCYRNYHNFVRRFPIYTNYYLNYSPIAHTNIIRNLPVNMLESFKSKYVIKEYNPEIIKTIVINKNDNNPNKPMIPQGENVKKEDKITEDSKKEVGSSEEPKKLNEDNKENKPLNKNSQKLAEDKMDKINKDKDNQDIIVINDGEAYGNNNQNKQNKIEEKAKNNEDEEEKKKKLDTKINPKKEENKPNEETDDRLNLNLKRGNGFDTNLMVNNNINQVKNIPKINEPISNSPLFNSINNEANSHLKLNEMNMGRTDNLLTKPDSSIQTNQLLNSNSMNSMAAINPVPNSQLNQISSQNGIQNQLRTPIKHLDDKETNGNHHIPHMFRFVEKKNYERNTFISENNKIILFGNQVITDSLSRFCSSHDDFLSCKFNFADHRKFYGIDIESCE